MNLVDFWVEDLTLGTTYCETFSHHILSKKERKYLVNDPTYFLFHVHNKFSSLNLSTPRISSLKISLTRGLKINFLLKFHVHYYGCMHGLTTSSKHTQQKYEPPLIRHARNVNNYFD